MQGWFTRWKPINVIHIHRTKEKKDIILIDAEKAFRKIQYPFTIKKKKKPQKIDGNFLNLTRDIYENVTANITLDGERMKAFPWDLAQEKDAHFYHFSTL